MTVDFAFRSSLNEITKTGDRSMTISQFNIASISRGSPPIKFIVTPIIKYRPKRFSPSRDPQEKEYTAYEIIIGCLKRFLRSKPTSRYKVAFIISTRENVIFRQVTYVNLPLCLQPCHRDCRHLPRPNFLIALKVHFCPNNSHFLILSRRSRSDTIAVSIVSSRKSNWTRMPPSDTSFAWKIPPPPQTVSPCCASSRVASRTQRKR